MYICTTGCTILKIRVLLDEPQFRPTLISPKTFFLAEMGSKITPLEETPHPGELVSQMRPLCVLRKNQFEKSF